MRSRTGCPTRSGIVAIRTHHPSPAITASSSSSMSSATRRSACRLIFAGDSAHESVRDHPRPGIHRSS
jgi:hypothetical protein